VSNYILNYLSQSIQNILYLLLFYTFNQYFINIYSILLVTLLYVINTKISFNIKPKNKNIPHLEKIANKELFDKNIQQTKVYTSKKYYGEIIYNKSKPNIIYIPENVVSKYNQSKVILYHELAHIVYNHKNKYIIYKYLILLVFMFLLTISTYMLILLIIIPLLSNYIKHQFEYQSDKFAVENTSINAVSKRLRTNQKLEPQLTLKKYIPYITPHPSIQKRLDKIHF